MPICSLESWVRTRQEKLYIGTARVATSRSRSGELKENGKAIQRVVNSNLFTEDPRGQVAVA